MLPTVMSDLTGPDGDGAHDQESTPRTALFDVNVLVALALGEHLHHMAAHAFLREWNGGWATTPMTESAFVRLLLNPAITGKAYAVSDIAVVLRGMRAEPRWMFLPDHSSLIDPQVDTSILVSHSLVTDVHLVNLAACRDMTLATFDRRLPTLLAPRDRRHVTVIPAGVAQ